MWWELATDLVWPSRGPKSIERSIGRIVDRSGSGTLRVETGMAGALKRGLDESGWLADEVIAVGLLEKGKAAVADRADHGRGAVPDGEVVARKGFSAAVPTRRPEPIQHPARHRSA